MTRFAYLTSAAIVLAGLAGSPAAAQSTMSPDVMAPDPDPTAALKDDCDVPSLDDSKVDSCLDRSRALQESTPSPDVDLLTSKLEQRSVQRFDPNSMTPPTTQAKGHSVKLDTPDNVTTPPDKMLDSNEANSADTRPVTDVDSMDNDGSKRPVQGDAKLDDGNPPDTNTDDPPPPDTNNDFPPEKNDSPHG
jgi:hypothetical protein